MLNNFIYSQSKGLFLEQLQAGNVPEDAIAFLEDSGEIWNRDHYFGSTGVSNLLTDGKLIGTITANNNPYNIYAPKTYDWSEITGTENVLTTAGGTIGQLFVQRGATFPLTIENTLSDNTSVGIRFKKNGVNNIGLCANPFAEELYLLKSNLTDGYLILHSGNYSDLITTLNNGLSIAGGLDVGGVTMINSSIASAKLPALGFIPESGMIVGTSTNGLLAYCGQNGQADIQVMRFDGTATAYALNLNPLGGAVNVGEGGLNVAGGIKSGDKFNLTTSSMNLGSATTPLYLFLVRPDANYIWASTNGGYLNLGVYDTGSTSSTNATLSIYSDRVVSGQRNNAVSLGTSSYRWSNVYSVLGDFSSRLLVGGATDDGKTALQVKGDIHVTGNIIADGEVSAGGGLSTTEDLLSYGVEWDTTQSTPDCTRIGNPLLHKSLPIQSKLRGCVANGNDINYYLYSEDWAYKEDGTTPSILDGTDGTVRVDTGAKFYIKSGSNGTKRWVRISTIQIDSSWIEVKRMLIDAYRCTVDTTDSSTPKTASVVNTSAEFRGGTNSSSYDSYLSTDVFRTQLGKPRTNLTRATMRTYAKNAGSQLLNYNDYKAVLYWLPVIEFATFNIQQSFNANPTSDGYKQGGLSAGVTNMGSTNWSNYNGYNPLTPCGYANSLGNHTGVVTFTTPADSAASAASVTAVTHSIARWRGFENIFGDIWTNLDGILIEYNATIGKHDVYSCDNSEYFADSLNEHYTKIGEQIASDGYIGEFDLGESAEIIPSSIGGSTTTKKCDYNYQTTSAGLRTLLAGSSAVNGGSAGLGCFSSYGGVGSADAFVGFRTSNYKD